MDHIARVTTVTHGLMSPLHGRETGFDHGSDICPLVQLSSNDRRETIVYQKCYSTRVTSCAHAYTPREVSCNKYLMHSRLTAVDSGCLAEM